MKGRFFNMAETILKCKDLHKKIGKKEILKPGTVHYCPMGHSHGMVNKGTEDFVMYAVVPNHKL